MRYDKYTSLNFTSATKYGAIKGTNGVFKCLSLDRCFSLEKIRYLLVTVSLLSVSLLSKMLIKVNPIDCGVNRW